MKLVPLLPKRLAIAVGCVFLIGICVRLVNSPKQSTPEEVVEAEPTPEPIVEAEPTPEEVAAAYFQLQEDYSAALQESSFQNQFYKECQDFVTGVGSSVEFDIGYCYGTFQHIGSGRNCIMLRVLEDIDAFLSLDSAESTCLRDSIEFFNEYEATGKNITQLNSDYNGMLFQSLLGIRIKRD
ncbi:MAG: hypothetical protein OXC96_00285 [Cyanobacteria bacterium MAG CAR1_bin_15]|nr:hypothetical protein [Cyanobacteria bacterium MAG CAR1_bin_15]